MKLSTAKIVLKLISVDEINGSEFKDKKLLEELSEEKIVQIKKLTPLRTKIKLISRSLLDNFLFTNYHIKDLNDYINIKQKKDISRNELSEVIGDTKVKSTKVKKGFYLNCFDDINIKIDDEAYILRNTPNGSTFINYLSKVELNKDTLLVIVENFENLSNIKKQKYLFEEYNKKIVFIFRDKFLYEFISGIENDYLYFGDIDLAAISIFLYDIKPKVKSNGKFFIPLNIDTLLADSNSKLYFKQYEHYKNLYSDESYLNDLIELIHHYKTTIEQESLY